MADADRRRRFKDYFDTTFKGDRGAFIKKTELTHGRVTHLFDDRQAFGERAAKNLAERLGLPLDFFEHDAPLSREALDLAAAYDKMQPGEKARLKLLMEAARDSVHSSTPPLPLDQPPAASRQPPAASNRPAKQNILSPALQHVSQLQWAEEQAQWDEWAASIKTAFPITPPPRPPKQNDN